MGKGVGRFDFVSREDAKARRRSRIKHDRLLSPQATLKGALRAIGEQRRRKGATFFASSRLRVKNSCPALSAAHIAYGGAGISSYRPTGAVASGRLAFVQLDRSMT